LFSKVTGVNCLDVTPLVQMPDSVFKKPF